MWWKWKFALNFYAKWVNSRRNVCYIRLVNNLHECVETGVVKTYYDVYIIIIIMLLYNDVNNKCVWEWPEAK